ncbi:MAG TPA: O-antigen ligase family protein [Candidatus Binatia bacterium]|nr:O-antigen ligase family protein [Candidatus Binatia bacterium]
MQTVRQNGAERSNDWSVQVASVSSKRFSLSDPQERSRFGYWTMVVFSFLYYFRPGDIIPGIGVLHLAKVTAFFAVLALALGTNRVRSRKLPSEIKIILAMFAWLIVTIPFASWRGGSFQVVFIEFSRIVIITLTLVLTVTRLAELRRLIVMQALGVALMTIAAVIVNNRMQGRLAGMGNGLLSNPNDLAMNIALNWPLCLVFLITGRGIARKLFWAIAMLVMTYAVMATYSRAGFLAIAVAILFCLWDFVIRRGRVYLLGVAALCLMGMLVVAPGNYLKRLETLVGRFQEGDYDRGSAEARKELLMRSLAITATHPVFGIGPGNFPSYTGLWRVTHNTYTQLSSECGIPALILFMLLLRRAFFNLFYLRKMPRTPEKEEVHLYASALSASFIAYLVGAIFSSSAYELFPYYMVIYTTLLSRLGLPEQAGKNEDTVSTAIKLRQRAYTPV